MPAHASTTADPTGTSRRDLLRGLAMAGGAVAGTAALGLPRVASAATPQTDADAALEAQVVTQVPETGGHVVLLGTGGGPVPFAGRTGISTAVVVDGFTYLVDFGHGMFDQLARTSLDVGRIPAAFITHLHSDHLADAFTLPWLRFGGGDSLQTTMHVYGPGPAGYLPPPRDGEPVRTVNPDSPTPGTTEWYRRMTDASAYDLNLRFRDESWVDIEERLQAHDILVPDGVPAAPDGEMAPPMDPFAVYRDERVVVTAVLVDHPPVFPSFAFRFDTAYGSVTVSGDTTACDNMVTLSRGVDLMVHEVIDLELLQLRPDLTPEQIAHLSESHTDVTTVGPLAERAGAKTLVLSHLAPSTKAVPDASWLSQAQAGFGGRVVVGNDLDVLPL